MVTSVSPRLWIQECKQSKRDKRKYYLDFSMVWHMSERALVHQCCRLLSSSRRALSFCKLATTLSDLVQQPWPCQLFVSWQFGKKAMAGMPYFAVK